MVRVLAGVLRMATLSLSSSIVIFSLSVMGLMQCLEGSHVNGKEEQSYRWVRTEGNNNPCGWEIVRGGLGPDRRLIHPVRVQYEGAVMPGFMQTQNKTHPALGLINDRTMTFTTYEVLCGNASWQYNYPRILPIPPNAIVVGNLNDDPKTPTYMCRLVMDEFADVIGYITDRNTDGCRVPSNSYTLDYFTSDYRFGSLFEILVVVP